MDSYMIYESSVRAPGFRFGSPGLRDIVSGTGKFSRRLMRCHADGSWVGAVSE